MNHAAIEFTLCHAKLACISLATITLGIVEGAASLNPASVSAWENVTFKGCLILAIVYLIREASKERVAFQKKTEEREDKVVEVIEKNTEMAAALLAETKRQTAFFDDVSSDVVKSALRTPAPGQNH